MYPGLSGKTLEFDIGMYTVSYRDESLVNLVLVWEDVIPDIFEVTLIQLTDTHYLVNNI